MYGAVSVSDDVRTGVRERPTRHEYEYETTSSTQLNQPSCSTIVQQDTSNFTHEASGDQNESQSQSQSHTIDASSSSFWRLLLIDTSTDVISDNRDISSSPMSNGRIDFTSHTITHPTAAFL